MHVSLILSFFRPACIAHTVAIPKHGYWAIYGPPRPPFGHAIHLALLVMTISYKGQGTVRQSRPLRFVKVVSSFKITQFLRLVSDQALQKHQVGLVLRKEEGHSPSNPPKGFHRIYPGGNFCAGLRPPLG